MSNVQKLWLDVFDFNERAVHVYKKLGFTIDNTIKPEIVCCKGDVEPMYLSVSWP